jgi:hypothetical protein
MRYDVLMKSVPLYADIESQINRLRLIRVLFLSECIVGLALTIRLVRAFTPLTTGILFIIILVTFGNYAAINYRFNRYCRTVEKAYKVLVLDPPIAENSSQKSQDG